MPIFPVAEDTSAGGAQPGTGQLAKAKQKSQAREMFERRHKIIDQILGEITVMVMPGATGYLVGGAPGGFEVDEHTFDKVNRILTTYLNNPDPEIRAAGYMCFQWYIDELPELIKHIWVGATDPDDTVAFCAASMLLRAQLSAADAPNIISLLHIKSRSAKRQVMRVMQDWGFRENHAPDMDFSQLCPAVPRLFEFMDGHNSQLRHNAAVVLRSLGPIIPDKLDHALALLNCGDLEQEKLATSILRGMGPLALCALPQLVCRMEADPTGRENGYYFQYWVAQAILEIEPRLTDMVVIKIAKNLGQLGDQGHSETRLLGGLGAYAGAAIPLLKSYQVGEVGPVYLNASKALSYIAPDDPEVIKELSYLMQVADNYDKSWILKGLNRATLNFDLARPALILALEDDYEYARRDARTILEGRQ